MSSKNVIKEHYGHLNSFLRVTVISKIRHQTCRLSDFQTECYMGGGGGGSDLQYGLTDK